MDPITQEVMTTLSSTEKYDTTLKNLLTNRQFLARIMKRFVREYHDIEIDDIQKKYIEPDSVSVSKVGVGRDTTNIVGDSNEDRSKTEGIVFYDIMFHAVYPNPKDSEAPRIGIYINLEIQNDYYPGYPLVVRAMYYGSRRLSSQLPQINKNTNYSQLQKVYSIWLCIGDNVPKKRSNSAVRYSIGKEDLIGTSPEDEPDYYDLLEVIMLYIRDDDEISDDTMAILQAACSKDLTKEERLGIMKERGMMITDDLERQVDDMCTQGEEIRRNAINQGIEQGIEQGLRALVRTLKPICKSFEDLYGMIVANKEYTSYSREQVLKYY